MTTDPMTPKERMTNQIFDRDDRDPNREPDPVPRGTFMIGLADARALWAVRVLDAWAQTCQADETRHWSCSDDECGNWYCDLTCSVGIRRIVKGLTPDAARHAAALAVYPTLPADVRSSLGECP